MRYRLRTLMIALAILPPMLAAGWFTAPGIARYFRPTEYWEIQIAHFNPDGSIQSTEVQTIRDLGPKER